MYFARWKVVATLAVVLMGILLALPNVLPERIRAELPSWLPAKTVHLGLDLQGGSQVLLEVDRNDLVNHLTGQMVGDIRQVLRDERIGYTGLGRSGTQVTVRIRNPQDVDRALERIRQLAQPIQTGLFMDGQSVASAEVTRDGDRIILSFTEAGLEARISRAVQQSIEIVRRRVDALGTTEPSITRQGLDRIEVQVPGLQDPARLKDLLATTAQLQFRLLCDEQPETAQPASAPPGCDLLYSRDEPRIPYFVQTSSRATVEGEDLTDAQPGFDQRNGEPIVSFRFNQRGAQRFGELTQRNVGKPFAIVLDNEVISAPVINEPILGGTGQISGRFTVEDANDLAIVLRSGALPAKLQIVQESSVGPSLGADSIRAGTIASVVAVLAVFAFMVVGYGLFGVFANIALIVNLILLFAALSVLQATLTLPGIAGIVLTIGMAVDANVLIYERIREEQRNGRSVIASLQAGFDRALATIIDSNVTGLIAAIVLFGMGSGPVRGFAVTMTLGIAISMFTAFTLTRMMVAWWFHSARPRTIPL
ncbi:protein translocase subunit SecD [Rhodoligotrophos defluvii]|uniref:protein translocase subunit SecD n=1 Tax=Rhodoligotrophos defluvii TaxID=2561934 RepID=UPI0010C9B61D|nr:protein translocase subunit SecD [Rhodoligotrophos defluvii]